MAPTPIVAPLLLALLALPAVADEPGRASPPSEDQEAPRFDLKVRALGGAFDGIGVHRGSGPALLVETDLRPSLRSGRWELAVPLRLDHRETFGADLDETVAAAALDASYRAGAVEHGPVAGLGYTWRPDWPDLYQPGCGGLCPTDRYSHVKWDVGYQVWAKLGGGRHLRAKARWVRAKYLEDPGYDPATSVVHLAPASNGEAQLDLSFRQLRGPFAYALRLDAYSRTYDDLLSKNALTGTTSASNPEERLVGAEPRAELQLRTKPLDVTVGYGFLAQSDRFAGYYSYTGHHPYVAAKALLAKRLRAEARAEAELLTFGPDSKQATEDGKRLEKQRLAARAALAWELLPAWALVAEGSVTRRQTNFPDYVPGVYPPAATRPYDIDWDYTNWSLRAGVEWKP